MKSSSIKKFASNVNKLWENYLTYYLQFEVNGIKKHIFIKDIEFLISREKSIKQSTEYKTKRSYDELEPYLTSSICEYMPTETLTHEMIMDFYNKMMGEIIPWTELIDQLNNFAKYWIPSTITTKDLYTIPKPLEGYTRVKVLLLGGGPSGLYISNYLKTTMMIGVEFEVYIIDNRIGQQEYTRKPFNRNRFYAYDKNKISSFFPHINCYPGESIPIKYLEYITFITAYANGVNMLFTDEFKTQTDIETLIEKGQFDIVFDCTGGRFKNSFINKTNPSFNTAVPKISDGGFEVVTSGNLTYLTWPENQIDLKYFLNIEVFDENGVYTHPAVEVNLSSNNDIKIAKHFANKCYKIAENVDALMAIITDLFSDKEIVLGLKTALIANPGGKIRFNFIEPGLYYMNVISDVVQTSTKTAAYVGVSDTIFSSHFLLGAGLERLITFITNVCWSIQQFANKN
jgi:hypothetical protein